MTKLWILFFSSLIIAYLIDCREKNKFNQTVKNEYLITTILTIVLVMFCGLRIWGNDTVTYLQMFDQTPLLDEIFREKIVFSFSSGMGFRFLTSVIKTIGFSKQDYLMFYAAITIIPYVIFIHKYSCNMTMAVFMMFTTGFYTFSMAAIKQSTATAFCLLVVDAAIERRWFKYAVWMIIACLFHPYAVIYLVVPFLFFRPWTKKTFIWVVALASLGIFMKPLINTVLNVTTLMGAEYTEESFNGAGVNIFRVIVSLLPMLLGVIYGKTIFQNTVRSENIMFNLAMINGMIMFVGLFGTANYFARLANYFLVSQVIVIPWITEKVSKKDKNILLPMCIIGYLGYFYYENGIIRPFDTGYPQITIWEYLKQLVLRGK